ncbi:Uncharacterized protein Fot_16686 [Forsythia ovata]|uniref:Uncharacterized protein n=1 Tax=Forsythia ovata TaxID=205694 RepID=A0ABD1VFR5_9LAMI
MPVKDAKPTPMANGSWLRSAPTLIAGIWKLLAAFVQASATLINMTEFTKLFERLQIAYQISMPHTNLKKSPAVLGSVSDYCAMLGLKRGPRASTRFTPMYISRVYSQKVE